MYVCSAINLSAYTCSIVKDYLASSKIGLIIQNFIFDNLFWFVDNMRNSTTTSPLLTSCNMQITMGIMVSK